MLRFNSVFCSRLAAVCLLAWVLLLAPARPGIGEPTGAPTAAKKIAPMSTAEPAWTPLVLPKALIVVGPWGDLFRWREALHAAGIMYDDAYRAQNVYHRPIVQLVGMPNRPEAYLDYSVVVLVNVDAPALGAERLDAIRDFVEQGGGLVVLGGYWAYAHGAYSGTSLETMLPITLPPKGVISRQSPAAVLAPGARPSWKPAVDFAASPRAFYVDVLAPRKEAVVELRAGDRPALISGAFGRGRVVACSLTVHGKAAENELAFWDWAGWPTILGQAVEWAGRGRPLRHPRRDATHAEPLNEEETEQLQLSFQNVTGEQVDRFVAAPTESAAEAFFEQSFGGITPRAAIEGSDRQNGFASRPLSPELIDALARFAQPDWQEPLLKAADELNSDRARRYAALELLGATRSRKAAAELLAALDDEDVAPAAIDGLARLGDAAHVPQLLRIYERSAAASDFRNPSAEAIQESAATRNGKLAVHAAAALYRLGDRGGVKRMVALFGEIRLMKRIYANGAKRRVVDTDAQGIAIRAAIVAKQTDFARLESQLLAAAGPIPQSQRKAYLEFSRGATDEAEIRWLGAALIESESGSHWSSLTQAQDGILRRLAAARSAE